MKKSNLHFLLKKIEPPFWYAGMRNTQLQLLFYGNKIAQYEVFTNTNGLIKEVLKTENPNYIFVTIAVKWKHATEIVFLFKKNNKIVFTQKYQIKQRRENSENRKGFDTTDAIYMLMPDRFANGKGPNNDDALMHEKYNRNLPEGRHGGDIKGIIKNLDYIQSLGMTALWCTPLCEDNDPVFSYHTYAQSNVYKIDPRFGTNADYLQLSAALHKRGMKLIHDYVTNHWGLEHWIIKDLPTHNWINQFEEYTQTNHKRTTIVDCNASKIDRETCIKGWFVPTMPDLNLDNHLVVNYLVQNAIWWIEYANLDGLRVDTYNYSNPEAMAHWSKSIMHEYPNFNIVGEITQRNHALLSYWQKDSVIAKIQNYNSNLPTVMDFALCDFLQLVFNEDDGTWDRGMTRIYDNFTNDFLYPNINNMLVFAENHDTKRLNYCYNFDFQKYKLAMVILATVRGIPQLYYGSEIGMAGDQYLGDADIRQDFPGGWAGDEINAFAPEQRTQMQKDYFDFTAKLFNWRKNQTVIHKGQTTHYLPEDNVYVYFRHTATQAVMVVINNSNTNQTIKMNRFAENLSLYQSGFAVFLEEIIDLENDLELEPKSFLLVELE